MVVNKLEPDEEQSELRRWLHGVDAAVEEMVDLERRLRDAAQGPVPGRMILQIIRQRHRLEHVADQQRRRLLALERKG